MRIAAIDVGSNSVRQIVADVAPDGEIRVVDEMKAQPRLGVGIASGHLDGDAMRRAADAIARMATLARQIGAQRIEAVATSAVRDAVNGGAFRDLIRREAGVHIRVLQGDEEARLSWRSALAHFDLADGRAVVADIGGGSLELALSAGGVLDNLVSLPLGAIRLTERYLGSGEEIRRRDIKALRRAARDELRAHIPAPEWHGAQLIGSGGTFTNLGAIVQARSGVRTAQSVHGTRISRIQLEHLLDALANMTLAERSAVPGLNPERADIIVAGVAVVAELLARIDARELVVSNYGIREGLLLETARVAPAVAEPGEARRRSVQQLAERCGYEPLHSGHVRDLALQLFDALGSRLGCAPEERQTLADAALLHDIGYHISYDRHHKHSYYLVLNADLLGMSPAEQVEIANLARYHRGKPPRRKHRNFEPLEGASQRRVRRLAALLRVADGFDRGHAAAVERLTIEQAEDAVRIGAVPRADGMQVRLELWGAERKAELLAGLLGCAVEIVAPDGQVAGRVERDAAALR